MLNFVLEKYWNFTRMRLWEPWLLHWIEQRFSTGGTRTTGGTPDVAKWYAKK